MANLRIHLLSPPLSSAGISKLLLLPTATVGGGGAGRLFKAYIFLFAVVFVFTSGLISAAAAASSEPSEDLPPIDLSLLHDRRKCEPIKVPICKDIGYNYTRMPNLVQNENQEEAKHQLDTFEPLIQFKCSSQLKFFLCSVYVPMCTDMVANSIGPCRPLCESVQKRCEPVLKQVGFSWPPSLNCSLFPAENNAKSMCMKGPEEPETVSIPDFPPPNPPDSMVKELSNYNYESVMPPEKAGNGGGSLPPDNTYYFGAIGSNPYKYCPLSQRWKNSRFIYINSTGRCAPLCNQELLFSENEEQTASTLMGSFAGLCLLFTISSIIASLTSSVRFVYPERTVLFIVFCSGMACIGHLIRLFSGYSSVACTDYAQASVYVIQGVQNLRCTVIFLFQYYFTLVSSIWWLVFCGTWALVVGLRVSPNSVEQKSSCFHFFAWALPGALMVVVLVRQSVESDELTGMCNVGNVNTKELLYFYILPHLVCVITGALWLIVGILISALCHNSGGRLGSNRAATPTTVSESVADPMLGGHGAGGGNSQSAAAGSKNYAGRFSSPMELSGGNNNKMDNLSLTLGLLAVFYIVPWTCIFAAGFHEYFFRHEWMPTVTLSQLQAQGAFYPSPNGDSLLKAGTAAASSSVKARVQPNFTTFVLKTVSPLVFGLVASIWFLCRVGHHFCLKSSQSKNVPSHENGTTNCSVSGTATACYHQQGGYPQGHCVGAAGLHSYQQAKPHLSTQQQHASATEKHSQNLLKQYIPLNRGHQYGNTII